MLFALIFTVSISIFLSVLSSSIIWKYASHSWHGFITSGSMAVVGILMMLIFDLWNPDFLTLSAYVLLLYGLCVSYFFIQLIVVLKITKQRRLTDVNL
ncbi:MAG TPA: hypothetical protein DEG42_01645 [Acholeplasmataceae bacterium]|nr:MAG: hypothetical protein A2Y43_03275 [Tenericutes bacterium GWA2_38_26]OHE31020.1 MAG: hypothetical protein A2084_00530 [Tenericutes bacterium GWC2_39_45]OHE32194.1 MAG: hypothetical protein A2009_04260 [Tenericutes bacterium GWD2_38_27]OHE37559.1 MAG: hypothetical protein A2013_05770 [Tenericutes bacterium GWE2_38_8]OHE44930.1 MAG: hypothetical protein A2102_03535 [Tenericutes bacterium GWF2_38_8]HBG33123.1 hypothetical protein [Acholeplasmataceae bacterium]